MMATTTTHRILPFDFPFFQDLQIEERVRQVFNTPISEWDTPQWIAAAIMLFLGLWCCGCVCQQRRSRRPYYYRGRGASAYHQEEQPGLMTGTSGYTTGGGGGGGSNNCLRNVLMGACCYEICCRDCQDIAPFLPGTGGGGSTVAKLPVVSDDYALEDSMERGTSGGAMV